MGFICHHSICFVLTAMLIYSTCIADWLAMTWFQLVTLLLLLFYCDYFVSLSCEKIIWSTNKEILLSPGTCWTLAACIWWNKVCSLAAEYECWELETHCNNTKFPNFILGCFFKSKAQPRMKFFSTQIFAGQCVWICWKTWAFGCSSQGCPPCSQKHECLSRGAGMSARPSGFGSLCLQDPLYGCLWWLPAQPGFLFPIMALV